MMFALRINGLAKGFSGISEDTLQRIVAAFNRKKIGLFGFFVIVDVLESCIPEIPSQGTICASGDLAPLSHLAAGLYIDFKRRV